MGNQQLSATNPYLDDEVDVVSRAVERTDGVALGCAGTESFDPAELDIFRQYRNDNNDTAVHMTCYEGYYDLLVVMLSNGFPVSPKNKDGNTPLHVASYCGHCDLVRLLLSNGANPDALNYAIEPPILLARENGHNEVISVLSSHATTSLDIVEDWWFQDPEMNPKAVMDRVLNPSYARRRDFLMFLACYQFLKPPSHRYPRERQIERVFATTDLQRYIMGFI